ncbi:golgin subfamily A member 1 isoform X2 [Varanus komodoensis]|uniref:golgin subfamily A member 1 isoform X2 n=1 Tax=Varanus komodoensis TaxID=61221 RepID=UPI001CF7E5FB|nr:golgin subfamily A member 1 isoform X2 [Varanus komodoensis]
MFAKLKKKIAEEAATAPRPGGVSRMPRSVSKESITSVGADSGDDFPSDGSSSREDLSSQLFRRNEQIRKLEIKLSDYAEQIRNLQKVKEKLENALETHQDSFVKKLQEQNEARQANTAKMAEGMALALEKKDQEWREKLSHVEKERKLLSVQLQEMREKSLSLFQKRDERDELEGFQQQELAKVKHMLLQKEASLAQVEQELGSSTQELTLAREELQASRTLAMRLTAELQELQRQHADLQVERDELLDTGESAKSKITALEQRAHELQAYIQQLSVDLQNAQVAASSCEKQLGPLQAEHESLKLEYEGHKQKMLAEMEEKDRLGKAAALEKRFEGSLSGDEHVRELLREKSALEQRLEEGRQQLSGAQARHAESVALLEAQINQLRSQLAEGQARLSEEQALVQGLRESSARQLQDLEQSLQLAREAAAKQAEELDERELRIQELEQLESRNEELKDRCSNLENSLRACEAELERLKAELGSSAKPTESSEERQKHQGRLQQEVADLTSLLKEKDRLLAEKRDALPKEEEELERIRQGRDAALLQMRNLQSSLEACQCKAAERDAVAEEPVSVLRAQLQAQQERLLASAEQAAVLEDAPAARKTHLPPSDAGEGEPNGEVAATDVAQLQKENRELEQQLAEKSKMIKQLQQRMAELKKTLQKELKIRPDGEAPEAPAATLTVTNNSDLNDSREINFEYLKHVVLKFMSCRESEAFHLIKAVSVLLNFSQEEENMLKETLEYKMSWFGSKPSPRGSIRPSISSPRTPWS